MRSTQGESEKIIQLLRRYYAILYITDSFHFFGVMYCKTLLMPYKTESAYSTAKSQLFVKRLLNQFEKN